MVRDEYLFLANNINSTLLWIFNEKREILKGSSRCLKCDDTTYNVGMYDATSKVIWI
jgi:hypothetical protein